MVVRGTARVAGDDHVIARLERVARDPVQLAGGGPLDGPALHLSALVGPHQVHEGMRIPEHELDHVPLDLDFLVGQVGGGERVMRVRRRAGHEDAGNEADQ
jgi:hypothetical protein